LELFFTLEGQSCGICAIKWL